jgi:hypothetical protein
MHDISVFHSRRALPWCDLETPAQKPPMGKNRTLSKVIFINCLIKFAGMFVAR